MVRLFENTIAKTVGSLQVTILQSVFSFSEHTDTIIISPVNSLIENQLVQAIILIFSGNNTEFTILY